MLVAKSGEHEFDVLNFDVMVGTLLISEHKAVIEKGRGVFSCIGTDRLGLQFACDGPGIDAELLFLKLELFISGC